jgi:hypothetical protein
MAMTWNTTVTELGLQLQTKQVQGATIAFTKALTGSGVVPVVNLKEQTAVSNIQQTVTIESLTVGEQQYNIKVLISNLNLATGYNLSQVGLYATDPDEGEILFAIAQLDTPQPIPSYESSPGYAIELSMTFQNDNGANITITPDMAGYVTQQAAQDLIDNTTDPILENLAAVGELGAKNLLKNTASTDTQLGVTYTVNADGSVTANGTPTEGNAAFTIGTVDLKAGKSYILSGCPAGGGDNKYAVYLQNLSRFDYGEGVTYTPQSNTTVTVRCVVYQGQTATNLTFNPMLRYAEIIDDTYVPYAPTNAELGDVTEELANGVDTITEEIGTKSNTMSMFSYDANNDVQKEQVSTEGQSIEDRIDLINETNVDNAFTGIQRLKTNTESSKTVTGNPITVNDAAPINAEDITVDITPVQDLHGYDKPWAGGAGKNKLPMTVEGIKAVNRDGTWSGNVYSIYNGTVEILTDSADNVIGIKVSGNFSAGLQFYIKINIGLPSGDYKLNGGISQAKRIYFYDGSNWYDAMGSDANFTITTQTTQSVAIVIPSGQNNDTFYPMIRLATETDATFAPYSNICPIEGRTGAELDRVGKNWFDKSTILEGYRIGAAGNPVAQTGTWISDYIDVKDLWGKSIVANVDSVIAFYSQDKSFIERTSLYTVGKIVPQNAYYLIVQNTDAELNTYQLELGTQPTAYEPYQHAQATIKFINNLVTPDFTAQTVEGITYTPTADGGVKMVGTATNTSTIDIQSSHLLKKGRYTMTVVENNVLNNDVSFRMAISSVYITVGGGNPKKITYNITSDETVKFQINVESGATVDATLHPVFYSAEEPGIIYGGIVDFNTGKVVVDRGYAEFDGSSDEVWSLSGGGGYRVTNSLIKNIVKRPSSGSATDIYLISNRFIQRSATDLYAGNVDGIGIEYDTGLFCAHYGGYRVAMTVADWKTWLSNNPLQVVYELAEPFTIQLTPAQLKMLKGINTLTCNGATITLQYQPDNVIAELKGATIFEIAKYGETPDSLLQSDELGGKAGIAYGDGIFVALDATRGESYISKDGLNWEKAGSIAVSGYYNGGAIAYGDGVFVAHVHRSSDNKGYLYFSNNKAKSWNRVVPAGVQNTFYVTDIAYGSGTFVTVGPDSGIFYSTDKGESWSGAVTGSFHNFYKVTYGEGTFVAAHYNGGVLKLFYSDTGTGWTSANSIGNFMEPQDLIYANGRFYALIGQYSNNTLAIYYSDDNGRTWTNGGAVNHDIKLLIYSNGCFVALGSDGLYSSEDGLEYTKIFSAQVTLSNHDYCASSSERYIFTGAGANGWYADIPMEPMNSKGISALLNAMIEAAKNTVSAEEVLF